YVEKFQMMPEQDIADVAFDALAHIFGESKQAIMQQCVASRVLHWSADPFALGAYSYKALGAEQHRLELVKPVENTVYFAGEALCEGTAASTVEGAFASGLDVARQVLLT